jgi:hypothetical protein
MREAPSGVLNHYWLTELLPGSLANSSFIVSLYGLNPGVKTEPEKLAWKAAGLSDLLLPKT